MPIPTYHETQSGTFESVYTCAHCGFQSDANVTAKGFGSASLGGPDVASERAERRLAEDVERMLDMVPCPSCKMRNDIAKHHRASLRWALIYYPLIVAGAGAFATGVMLLTGTHFRTGEYGWMAGVALLILVPLSVWAYVSHFLDRRRAVRAVEFVGRS